MKRIKNIWFYALAAAAVIGAAPGCTDSKNVDDPYANLSTTRLDVTKKGVSPRGQVVSFNVESNVYWTMDPQTQTDWISLSPSGGQGSTTVRLTVDPNEGASRSVVLILETKDGEKGRLTVTQGSIDEEILILQEFAGEDEVSSNEMVNLYGRWTRNGVSAPSAIYSGTDIYISSAQPCDIDGSSAGNNVFLDGEGKEFHISELSPSGENSFLIDFNYYDSGNGENPPVKLYIGNALDEWAQTELTVSPGTAGWNKASFEFSIIPGIPHLNYMFVSAVADLRLDDIVIAVGNPAAPVIKFGDSPNPQPEGLPVSWTFFNTAQNGGGAKNDNLTYTADDNKTGTIKVVRAANPTTAEASLNGSSSDNPQRILVYGVCKNDYWLFTAPVKNIPAGTAVNIKGKTASSDAGPKYFIVEASEDGTNWTSLGTTTEMLNGRETTYTLALTGVAQTPNEFNQSYVTRTDISKGNIYFRLIVSDNKRNVTAGDMAVGNGGTTRLQESVTISVIDTEGLPAVWSFPNPAPEGVFDGTARTMLSDDGKAKIGVEVMSTNSSIGNTTYSLDGEMRMLTTGLYYNDYWYIEVPVKKFEPIGVNLKARMSSSTKGPKYLVIEYSADDGVTWTAVNTKKKMGALTGDAFPRMVTYTFELTGTDPFDINQNINIPTAISDGKIMIRLRVASTMAADVSRDNNLTLNGGTNRLRQSLKVSYGYDPAGSGYANDDTNPGEAGYVYYDDFSWASISTNGDYFQSPTLTSETVVTGWTGEMTAKGWTSTTNRLYSRPGYLKIGTASNYGDLVSPALAVLQSGSRIAEVKISLASYTTATGTADTGKTVRMEIAEGPGTVVMPATIEITNFSAFAQYSFIINGAEQTTKLRVRGDDNGKNRFMIDDVYIYDRGAYVP